MKKMYLVKREVMANNISQAMRLPGKIYSVEIAEEKFQPDPVPPQPAGFAKKNKKDESYKSKGR